MTGGRHLGTTASISPRHLATTACYLIYPFPFIADHYEWLPTPLRRCQFVGTGNKSEVGFTQLLSDGEKFPGVSDHAGRTEHPLLGRGMGWCGEAPARYGIHFDSTKCCHGVWKSLWPGGSVGTSCQACYHSLEEVAHKFALLVDESADWAYTFVWLNKALSHGPLSSEGHISTMTDGVPCVDTHGQLHQLQICKLLQHDKKVVCPEGLNGELEALQFSFPKVPLWNEATPSEPPKPQLIEVDLGSMQPESKTTSTQAPTTTLGLPPSPADTIVAPMTLPWPSTCNSRGLGMAATDFPHSLCPCLSVQHAQERAVIGGLGGSALNWRKRISTWARGDRLSHLCPNGNLHTDASTGSHTRWHPKPPSYYSPAATAHHAEDTGGG